jgi:hypothetical protein
MAFQAEKPGPHTQPRQERRSLVPMVSLFDLEILFGQQPVEL